MKNKGISAVEVLIIIALIGLISAVVFPTLSQFHKQQILKNTTEDVVSLINEARNSTISSKNSLRYGIHFETDRVVLYSGDTYNVSPSNKEIIFDSIVWIPESDGIDLVSGGEDVTFTRITGDVKDNEYGSIKIQIVDDASKESIININQLGIVTLN